MVQEVNKDVIYLYAGPGSDPFSLEQTEQMLTQCLKDYYHVERIYPEDVIHQPWETKAACFVIPGGRSKPYYESLEPVGTDKIKEYVKNGGSYLGICAGAYFAAQKTEFALGSPDEIRQDGILNFCASTASGPVLAYYDYNSRKGARAAKIKFKETTIFLYFNGGCTFLGTEKTPHLDVLGHYTLDNKPLLPAITHIMYGQGCVILSGVHFEFNPLTMDSHDPYLTSLIPIIQSTNTQRLLFIKQLLGLLKLQVSHE